MERTAYDSESQIGGIWPFERAWRARFLALRRRDTVHEKNVDRVECDREKMVGEHERGGGDTEWSVLYPALSVRWTKGDLRREERDGSGDTFTAELKVPETSFTQDSQVRYQASVWWPMFVTGA